MLQAPALSIRPLPDFQTPYPPMHNDMEIQSISETNDGSTLEEGV